MAKRKRNYGPLLLLLAGIAAFIAALNFILGSPIQAWLAALPMLDEPLLGALVLMLVVAIVPIVVLVNSGKGEDGKK